MVLYFRHFCWISVCCAAFFMAGCATARKPSVLLPAEKPLVQARVQHKVRKGETLWRIAKAYNVSVDDIIRVNNIPNAASIEENQLLVIPGSSVVRDVALPQVPVGNNDDYAWPVKGKVIAYFEDRKGASGSSGIDIRATEGEIVNAARGGRVVFADYMTGYGYTVILDHSDGFFTVYGHTAKALVSLGDYVTRGTKLAQLGNQTDLAFLHFEVRRGETPTNPLHYLP
ncbi:MAG: peptidoglycan DD-metalloendopeptidase family protein [Candidatus Omnitrophica bacterium]|nr:peptidoglycan DD-metalloendopeptidase family protein [Candidatus Omnitrophota bacterium]